MPVAEPGRDVGQDSNGAELGPVTCLALWGCHIQVCIQGWVLLSHLCHKYTPHVLGEHTAGSSPASGSFLTQDSLMPR